jgi:hypothetical protein
MDNRTPRFHCVQARVCTLDNLPDEAGESEDGPSTTDDDLPAVAIGAPGPSAHPRGTRRTGAGGQIAGLPHLTKTTRGGGPTR